MQSDMSQTITDRNQSACPLCSLTYYFAFSFSLFCDVFGVLSLECKAILLCAKYFMKLVILVSTIRNFTKSKVFKN